MRSIYFSNPILSTLRKMASSAQNIIDIDGSILEGGGQVLRISMGFSALCKKPIRIQNIRGKRSKPGLKAQHLTGMLLIRDLTQGELKGASLNSTEIEFHPKSFPAGGNFVADTKTAGAVTLLVQVSLPCLIFANDEATIDLMGGTNADMAPQIDYLLHVFKPHLNRFGTAADFQCRLQSRGYFPRGGGKVNLQTRGSLGHLEPVQILEHGEIESITITALVAGKLPLKIAQEMSSAAKQMLLEKLPKEASKIITENKVADKAQGNGSSIFILAKTSTGCVLAGSANGSPKKKPYQSGLEAAEDLLQPLKAKACLDHWMQDQIIMYMALSKGISKVRVSKPLTLHTETAIHLCEKFCSAKFKIIEEKDHKTDTVVIECEGCGFEV